MAKRRKEQPWWVGDGTEICSACSQSYAYHTEVRCVDCDQPHCPICYQVTTTVEFSCQSCCDDNAELESFQ